MKTDKEYQEIFDSGVFPSLTIEDMKWIDTNVTEEKDTKDASYMERNSGRNIAEERFEKYCIDRKVKFHRFGFDEKKSNIDNFFLIPSLLRSLPDYIVPSKDKIFFVQVKGTNKMKLTDIKHYDIFSRMFCTKDAQLVFYFCFTDEVKVITIAQLMKMIPLLPVKRFENDNKEYVELPI